MKLSQRKIDKTIKRLGLSEDEAISYLCSIKNKPVHTKRYKHHYSTNHVKFIATGDSHISNMEFKEEYLDVLFQKALDEKVEAIYHTGDITDGMYSNRPEQMYELEDLGFDAQVERATKLLSQSPVKIYAITGNHDFTHYRNTGADVGVALEGKLGNFTNLGQDEADIELSKNVTMKLIHPGKGTAYAHSYNAQKLIESFEGGMKPNIVLEGHYHKLFQFFYRGVHHFDTGTLCGQTRFFRRMNLAAMKGFWVLDVRMNNTGVESIVSELVPFYD